ncbi:hypothetical protein PSP6_330006 [Paraburkholderia tropica]|nr:hypothetical protein PSP6_330006 [Paraburkholderia tropica]
MAGAASERHRPHRKCLTYECFPAPPRPGGAARMVVLLPGIVEIKNSQHTTLETPCPVQRIPCRTPTRARRRRRSRKPLTARSPGGSRRS